MISTTIFIISLTGRILSSLLLNASTEGAFTTASGRKFYRFHTQTVGKSLSSTVLNLGGTSLKPLFRVLLAESRGSVRCFFLLLTFSSLSFLFPETLDRIRVLWTICSLFAFTRAVFIRVL